jgi:DNA-binding SARP family transcriptional activator
VDFRILGPLEVAERGELVALGPAKQRAILGILLLHANEVVSSAHLIDELWGERPPPTAAKLVQVYVSQLRRALEVVGGEDVLRTRAPGYTVVVAPERLDAARFAALVSQARGLADRGALSDAVATYEEALSLWRGPVLADLAFESHARIQAERLVELHLAALGERIDCELALGHHAQLIGELESLTAEDPLHERFWSQLMLALYRSGRQSEALGAYHHARRTLRDEVGLAPGPELRRLEKAILAHDPGLELAQPNVRAATAAAPHTAEPRRRRWSRGLLVGAAAAIVAVALAAGVLLTHEARPVALASISRDSVGIVDTGRNALVGEIPLHTRPAAIAVDGSSLWVATKDEQTLLEIDLRTHKVLQTHGLGAEPTAVAAGGGFVWVLCGPAMILFQFDGATGTLMRRLEVVGRLPADRGRGYPLPPLGVRLTEPFDVAAGGGAAWLAYAGGVARVDARTGAVEQIQAGGSGGVAFGQDAAWTVGALRVGEPPLILRIDPASRAVTETIRRPKEVGEYGSGIAVDANAVWELHGSTIWMVDAITARVAAVIPLGHTAVDIGVGEGAVWTANEDGTVSRIDAKTGVVSGTIPLGNYPRRAYPVQLAVGHDAVWIAMH